MSFIKDFIVYESKGVKVFINQCHTHGMKTKLFSIRRGDNTGLGHLLGVIKFSGRWRQYVSGFERDTIWSAGCKEKIAEFERIETKKWRDSLKKKKVQQ